MSELTSEPPNRAGSRTPPTSGHGAGTARRAVNPVRRRVERWSLAVLCVLVWQWLAGMAGNPYVPTPTTVLGAAGRVCWSVLPSLARVAVGWGAAAVVGVVVALALGRASGTLARVVPVMVAVPLVLLHVGTAAEVGAIAFGSFWPVLSHAADGVRSVDPVAADVASVYRVPWYVRVCVVLLPAAAPRICTGLRVGLAVAFCLMGAAEIGRDGGVPNRWAWVVLVAAVWGLATWLVGVLRRRVSRWWDGGPAAD